MHSCSCLRYLARLWVPGDAARTVLAAYWDLLGFPLHIGVCVFGLTDVVRELLIGLCSVLLSYILTTAVSGVVCWCRTNFSTGTYQAHFSFFPLSVEIMGHYSIAIMNRRLINPSLFSCI